MFVAKYSLSGKNNFNSVNLTTMTKFTLKLQKSLSKILQRFYNHTKSFTHED